MSDVNRTERRIRVMAFQHPKKHRDTDKEISITLQSYLSVNHCSTRYPIHGFLTSNSE